MIIFRAPVRDAPPVTRTDPVEPTVGLDFFAFEAMLRALPASWLPPVTAIVAAVGYERGVWRPGGCSAAVVAEEIRSRNRPKGET